MGFGRTPQASNTGPSFEVTPLQPGPSNGIARCQLCGNMRHTKYVEFYRNVGMLIVRRTYTIRGELCRPCIHKRFWEFAGKNILLGPWGTISIIVTPIYLVQNTGRYVVALYKLRDAPE
jgi:hypothetical protein